jgi:probable phosphoglycerate mutase
VTELFLVRHAETVWNAEGRWQGQTDVPLSERGRAEIALVAARLRSERFDHVVSSDLVRAHDTARAIAGDRPITLDPALREMHLGAWCGLLHHEVVERHPDQLRALQRGEDARIGGDGETVVELAARVTGAIDRILAGRQGERVLVVTHGGVIRSILLELLGLSGRARPLVGSRNTAITRIHVAESGARTLRSYNDARHLAHASVEDEETLSGASAKARVVELLEPRHPHALAEPAATSASRVVTSKRQLVSYALDT